MNSENSISETETVRAVASPVLELVYSQYFIRRKSPLGADEPDWLQRLRAADPGLLQEMADIPFTDGIYDLFFMSTALGYSEDSNTGRFLADFRTLPQQALQFLNENPGDQDRTALKERLTAGVTQPDFMHPDLLGRLWSHLEPEWQKTGLQVVLKQAEAFMAEFRESGDPVRALPPFHFTRLEKPASRIREASHGEILVVPLYFANAGGFSFEVQGRQFIGYGLQSDSFIQTASRRVDAEARKLKALADPTRLLLLTLITRYAAFSLTVGDLARHLDVSQPTVSGHLKVLREAGLVTVEREANRSYYRPQPEAVSALLDELGSVLLPRRT